MAIFGGYWPFTGIFGGHFINLIFFGMYQNARIFFVGYCKNRG